MKKECFFERKTFSEKRFLFKSLLDKNGKAQNMPVVAGRLVEHPLLQLFLLSGTLA